jgi:hypothetical protein
MLGQGKPPMSTLGTGGPNSAPIPGGALGSLPTKSCSAIFIASAATCAALAAAAAALPAEASPIAPATPTAAPAAPMAAPKADMGIGLQ